MEPTRDRDYFLMTTKTEQRQAIWYVTGLAEVLVGPGAQDQSDDAIVQFDRYRRTRTPSPPNASPDSATRPDDDWISGAMLLDVDESQPRAEELVRSVGELIPRPVPRAAHGVLIPDGSLLIWDNQRMLHARSENHDRSRRLTGFWSTDWRRA